jgi:hypothetical protein
VEHKLVTAAMLRDAEAAGVAAGRS